MRFWQGRGNQIRSLTFQAHSLGPVSFLEILLACPNLEELSFPCQYIYNYDPYEPPDSCEGEFKFEFQQPSPSQKLIPHLGLMKETGVLGKLKTLVIQDSNYMPNEILRDFLQWGVSLVNLNLTTSSGRFPEPRWDVGYVVQLAERRCKSLTRLELTGSHILPEHILALAKIKDLSLKVIRFQFAQVTESALSHFFRRQKNLEEIDLSFTKSSEKAFTHPTCTFQKLKKLNLAGFSDALEYLSFLSRMPNLASINLSGSRSRTMTWDLLVSGFPTAKLKKLRCLDLSNNLCLGNFQKQSLFTGLIACCRSVTCLNLSSNICMRDTYLQTIWRNMSGLRIVFLEGLTTVTDEGFTGIRHSQLKGAEASGKLDFLEPWLLRRQNKGAAYIGDCPNIQVLSLSFVLRLTDTGIQFGIKSLSKLQKLKLAGCNNITDTAMFYLTTGCTHLSFLDLRGLDGVSSSWMDWAKISLPRLSELLHDGSHHSNTSFNYLRWNQPGEGEDGQEAVSKQMFQDETDLDENGNWSEDNEE